ncbi:MAG: NosD domain-containing protein, partial [Candidatus Thermoplasmatota archaeon]
MKKKWFAVGIILLFVGVIIAPTINFNTVKAQDTENPLPTRKENRLCFDVSTPGNDHRILGRFSPVSQRWISKTHTGVIPDPAKSSLATEPPILKVSNYDGKTLYVGGNGPGNYSLIQRAINAASPGDTVFVYTGTYRQNPIFINKSIRLLGENPNTTILENRKQVFSNLPIIDISESDGVTVQGFTIRNRLEMTSIFDYVNGIEISTHHNNISTNKFENCTSGIHSSGNYNTFSDNMFKNDSRTGLYVIGAEYNHIAHNRFYGEGLVLLDSFQSIIEDNFVNDKPLVVLEDASDTVINEAGQVLLLNCQNITVRGVNVSNTTIGIYLRNSKDCKIEENIVNGETEIGVFLEYSSHNTFSRNHIQNSDYGMLLGASLDNIITSNDIAQNNQASLFLSYSTDNIITNNTFRDNAYWSNYMGLVLTSYSDFTIVANNTFIHDCVFVYGSRGNQFSNNTVNGYALIYLEGASERVVDEVAGQVILNECNNIDVRGQKNLTKTDVLIVSCLDCSISNISTPSRFYGM